MNHSTIQNLAAIANACDEAIAALESDGAEPLILQGWSGQIKNFLAALTPLLPPSAQPQPTGRFSGVRTPGAASAPAPVKTVPLVQAAPKSAPAAKPAPAPAQKTGHLLKITPPPLKRRRMAGM